MATTILTAATAASASEKFIVGQASHLKPDNCAVIGFGFSTDSVPVQISYDSGTTWVDLKINGTAIVLADAKNYWTPTGPGVYRINKGITTGTVGFVLSTPESP